MPKITNATGSTASEKKTESRASGATRRKSTPKATPSTQQVAEAVSGLYGMLGGGVTFIGQVKGDVGLIGTGQAIVERSEAFAQEWMDLGKRNPTVGKMLERLADGAGIGGLVMLHLAVLTPVLASNGAIPDEAAAIALMMTDPNADEKISQAFEAMRNMSSESNGNGQN